MSFLRPKLNLSIEGFDLILQFSNLFTGLLSLILKPGLHQTRYKILHFLVLPEQILDYLVLHRMGHLCRILRTSNLGNQFFESFRLFIFLGLYLGKLSGLFLLIFELNFRLIKFLLKLIHGCF